MKGPWKLLLKEYGESFELITWRHNCLMKFLANMFNNLKHTSKQMSTLAKNVNCKLQRRFLAADDSHPKITDNRISEII